MTTISNKIEGLKADITKIKVDAIVNAANASLSGGGGVDGAIHRAGGVAIINECRKIVMQRGACKTGEAVITTAGNLPARFVIHTVGPVWNGGENDEGRYPQAQTRHGDRRSINRNEQKKKQAGPASRLDSLRSLKVQEVGKVSFQRLRLLKLLKLFKTIKSSPDRYRVQSTAPSFE